MKLDLSIIDPEEFIIRKVQIAGEDCTFIVPQPNFFDWREDVLHLRSSIWNSQGELISGSYKKFFNFEEKPAIRPFNENLGFNAYDKLDGSTLIISTYKGELIARTRGTICLDNMANGDELKIFQMRYPGFFDVLKDHSDNTFLFEWTSPRNKIILDYGKVPEIYLTSIVDNKTYTFWEQDRVEQFASELGLKRPVKFPVSNLSEFITFIERRTDIEGICLYYNNDQDIRKIKSLYYLKLHSFKSNLSPKALIDLYIEWGQPKEEVMLDRIEREFDFECATMAQSVTRDVFPYIKEIENKIEIIGLFVAEHQHLEQKEFAIKLQNTFSKDLTSFGFSLRKTKTISTDYLGKLLKLHFKEEVNKPIYDN